MFLKFRDTPFAYKHYHLHFPLVIWLTMGKNCFLFFTVSMECFIA